MPSELKRAQQLAMFTPAADATYITQALHARARALWQSARADLVQHDGFGAQLAFTHGLVASSTGAAWVTSENTCYILAFIGTWHSAW